MTSGPATGRIDALLAEASWLEGLARALVTDRDEARDLVQDVWVAATERAPARIDRPRAWLAEVLRNALRARRRSAGPRAARERARARDAAVAGTGDVVERAEAQRLLVEHVLALDEPWRSTVLLRFFDGLSSEEIARRTGAPPSTIRNRLAHALGLLRARLERSRSNWMAGIAPLAFGGRRIGIGFGWSSGGTAMAGMLKVGGGLAAALAAGWWWLESRAAEPRRLPALETSTARASEASPAATEPLGLVVAREPLASSEPLPAVPSSPPAPANAATHLPSGVLEVALLDDGAPCPHAGRVVLAPGWQPWMWSGDEEPPETAVERVLVDGRARFEGLEPGSYGARASLADHVDLHAYVVIPEAKGTMLTLRSGTAVVEGTAWDEEGRPTPGLKIVLSHKASNTTTYTWTGEDGRYALDRLEPGAHWVSMNGRDVIRSSTTILPGLNRLDFGSPEPCPHWSGTLRTRSGSAHRGRMVLWIRRTPQDLTTRVVEDGRFDLRLLPGTYRVIGKPDAFSSFEVDLGEIVVPPGDFERDLVLPGARVSGVLRRSDGAPLSESSRLTVGLRAPDGKVGLRSVLADEASRFTIDAVEPGVYLLSTHPLVVDGGGESLRLELLSGQDELVLDVFVRAP